MTTPRPRAARLLAVGALALSALAGTAAAASADAQSDYDTGLALGTKAYQYGLPLLDFERLYETQTSVNVPDNRGNGPVNQFSHVRRLLDASDRNVVAPNSDTLYSIAWLDLRKGPQVVRVPAIKDRFYVIPFYDPYTNDFYNVTSNKKSQPGAGDYGRTNGGAYAVVPPGFKGKLPKGVKRVQAPQYARADPRAHVHQVRERHEGRQQGPGRVHHHAALEVRRQVHAQAAQEGRQEGRQGDHPRHAAGPGPARLLHGAGEGAPALPRARRPTSRCSTR